MCPLCSSPWNTEILADNKSYWLCPECNLRYLDPRSRLAPGEEKERYLLHEAGDERYLQFVRPLTGKIEQLVPKGATGLDFGAGRYPVLSEHLQAQGYLVSVYDSFFWPGEVKGPFDFIVACEVAEHLYNPAAEFRCFRDWLNPGGRLFIMTDLVQPGTDFVNWYYRRDPTHVVFYSAATFAWIQEHFGFKSVEVEGRVAVLSR